MGCGADMVTDGPMRRSESGKGEGVRDANIVFNKIVGSLKNV